jgi:hypothetical protein
MPYPHKRHLDGAASTNPRQRKKYYNKDNNNRPPRAAGAPHLPQAMRSVTSDSENDENSWHPDLPPFPRMTPDDERLANEEGHFFRRLLEAGLVEPDGAVTALGNLRVAPMNATYIHLTINKMLSMNRRYQTVIAVVRDVGVYMGSVNIATAMHRLGRLVRSARAWNPNLPERMVADPRYQYLLKRAEDYIDEMTPRALANFLWGMAALGDGRNTGMVLRVGRRLLTINPAELKTQELSNILWSMATLEVYEPDLVNAILDSACDRIDDCVPQALSNMIWASATLRHFHPRFPQAVAESAAPRLETFQSQTLANTLWAYSVLGLYPTDLFNKAADEIVRRLVLKDQNMSKTSGKFNSRQKSPSSSESSSSSFKYTTRGDNTSSNTTSSSSGGGGGSGGGYNPKKYQHSTNTGGSTTTPPPTSTSYNNNNRSEDTSAAASSQFQGQEISNVLIAYARGCIIHPALLQALEKELCRTVEINRDGQIVHTERLKEFTSQALANTLWAFATLRWYPARLLPSITEAIGNIVHAMTAQELANSLWAYARFAYHPGRVMASLLSVVERRVHEFEGQGCTNSLWALAVLKATHSAAFVGLLQRYVTLERSAASFGELQYNQVLQAVLLAQFEARGGRVAWRPEVDLPETVVDRALAAWASQQMSTQLSGFHLDVSEGLTRLGVPHLLEHLVARDLLSIDIAVIDDGRKLAIEVDGPFHFPVNARTPLGHTMIRRRLLRAAGWTVLSIPWYEWFSMHIWDDRLKYLTEVLSKADERFADQLKPATRELLSTNFAPGPGPGAEIDEEMREENKEEEEEIDTDDIEATAASSAAAAEGLTSSSSPSLLKPRKDPQQRDQAIVLDPSQITASGSSFDEGEDGPVLSYYSNGDNRGSGTLGIDNGLLQVLSRSNVQLTSGAVRRLQSMGLDDMVREVGERRKAKKKLDARRGNGGGGGGGVGGFDKGRGGGSFDESDNSYWGSSSTDVYAPPPSMQASDGDPMLMPKPQLPGASNMQGLRRPTRFTPRFVSEKSSNWGYFPPTEEVVAMVARRDGSRKSAAAAARATGGGFAGSGGGGVTSGRKGLGPMRLNNSSSNNNSVDTEAVFKRVLHGRHGNAEGGEQHQQEQQQQQQQQQPSDDGTGNRERDLDTEA